MPSAKVHSSWGLAKGLTTMFLCLFLFECEDQGASPSIADGTYLGQFTVRLADGIEQSEAIDFTFRNGRYSYTPGQWTVPPVGHSYLPPSGAGRYTISGSTIVLTDTLLRTADTDWSNILGGSFLFSTSRRSLTLMQEVTETRWHKTIVLTYQ